MDAEDYRRRNASADEHRRAEYAEVAAARHRWATERGCRDFVEAMQIGLVAVGKRQPGWRPAPGEAATALGVTAREFSPSLERMAADRTALGLEGEREAGEE